VNTSSLDATAPATAADASGNVFIAWEEAQAAPLNGKIMIRRYNLNGGNPLGPVQADNNQGSGVTRHDVALAVDGAGNVIATWWEGRIDGSQPEMLFMQRLSNNLGLLGSQTQVNNPPGAPFAGQRVGQASIATDFNNNFVIAWNADVNATNDSFPEVWTGFAKSYDSAGNVLKNDFRVDVNGRALTGGVRVARSSEPNTFAFAWRDNRSGHFDMYTRAVQSVP